MTTQRQPVRTPDCAIPSADAVHRAPPAHAALRGALVDAQARRIQELERRLAERSRVLTDAAEALAGEIRRREQAQAALFEAQKLESFGHLAGGLAHDLRNVLGTMGLGYQVLQHRTTDPGILRVAENGTRALKQADRLIEGLLNLMRRHDDQAELVHPAQWLPQMEDLLGYAAGRRVACRLRIGAGVWPVRVDEHRLGAALINLAVNARDAMPDGGELIVSAFNLPQGAPRPAGVADWDLVVFSVADDGCGMTPEVLARATDPLFSTKPPGQGTGLGLSMVQGFALASSGHLTIASEPGQGTRVELYLPRSDGLADSVPGPGPALGSQSPTRQSLPTAATVMLVDDDDLMRPALAAMLRGQGYRVVESCSAEVALALLHTIPSLTLVVADVVLPGADGATLVQRLRQERPGLPALFIAGHALRDSPLTGVPLLRKPMVRGQLESAVLGLLGQPRTHRETDSELLDRLVVRLRSPDLLAALLAWREARGGVFLPSLDALEGIPPILAERTFIALREGSADDPSFRYLSVGPALAAQLGRSLEGEPIGGTQDAQAEETLVGTLASAYRRALRTGLPSYEYARYTLDDGAPVLFERLILPVSRDGEQVSHLLGFVLFLNLPSTATVSPMP
jgi:signal transduction histidine kinase/CheY-like chemotaxis protein